MTLFCLAGGILNPDTSLYLLSGLKYAGMDYFNVVDPVDLYFTPIVSFLSSLFFRLGMVSHSAIIIVTSVFAFFAYIGLYILLKNRFNPLLSLTGVFIYGSFSLVLFNMCKGLIDIPAMSISIWILIFAIMAVDKNPKYYLIALPLFVVGFFVKYTVGFMLPIIVLYYVMDKDIVSLFDSLIHERSFFYQTAKDYIKSSEFRYILASILISAVLFAVICKTLILDCGGTLSFLGQSANTFNGFHFHQQANHYDPSKSAYLKVLPKILFQQREGEMFILANTLIGIIIIGFLIKLISLIKNRTCMKNLIEKRQSFKTRYLEILVACGFVISLAGMLYYFKISNHMYANIFALIAIVLAYSLAEKLNFKNKNVTWFLLFLGYFTVNFIFCSIYEIKVFRYCLIFIPPFIYFIIWGLESIMDVISNGIDSHETFKSKLTDPNYSINLSKISKILPVIIIVVYFTSAAVYFAPMEMNSDNAFYPDVIKQGFVSDLEDACEFIKNNDSDYHNKTFAAFSHHERTVRWYLNCNVTQMNGHDPNLKNFDNATYLIIGSNRTFNNYHVIKNVGDFNIYIHN